MLKSIREIVYTLRNALKSLTPDDRLSNRLLAHLVYNYAVVLLRRAADERKLWKETSIWQEWENCLEFEPFNPDAACGNLYGTTCGWVRSKERVPEHTNTVYGPLLQLLTIDYGHSYTYKEASGIANFLGGDFGTPRYFTLVDNYIWIPNATLQKMRFRGVFLYPLKKGACQSPLDYPLYLPPHLLMDVERLVTTDLRNTTLPIPPDELPNANTYQKGQTQQAG